MKSYCTLLLRAERAGPGNGRVYTITVDSTDRAGNSTTSSVAVTVPHDQGKASGEPEPRWKPRNSKANRRGWLRR